MKRTGTLLLILLAGCSSPAEDRCSYGEVQKYFGAIVPGKPEKAEGRTFRIPLSFGPAKELHSAICLKKVEASVQGKAVRLRTFRHVPLRSGRKADPSPRVALPGPGPYALLYEDPDGSTHPLGTLEVP